MTAALRSSLQAACALALATALGCRNSEGGPVGVRLVPNALAASGCTGPDQAFGIGQAPSAVALVTFQAAASSQVTAAGDSEALYLSGANGTVVAVDVSGPAPVETELVAAGEIAALLAGVGIVDPPELSGLCVLDASTLLAMEHSSNTIVAIDRSGAVAPSFFAGQPNTTDGFADGTALSIPGFGQARFAFTEPSQLLATDPTAPFVIVADSGNHALRRISGGAVRTLAGSGTAFFADGDLSEAGFDTPAGVTLTCTGTILVSELGAAGQGGQRLRQVLLGPQSFFGISGTVLTRAGDGVDATIAGDGEAASLAQPMSPLTTSEADTYWIDSTTGILRRMRGALDTVDCPLWMDCAAAVLGGGDFTPGGRFSLTQTPSGVLYVLDVNAATLWRVTP